MKEIGFNRIVIEQAKPWLDSPASGPAYVIAGQLILIGILLGLLLA